MADANRAALAAAIVKRDGALREVEAARDALEHVRTTRMAARERLEAARNERVLELAPADMVRALREARADEADAEADLEASEAARTLCRAVLAEAENALALAEGRVADAAGAVMAGSAGKILSEIEALEKALAAKRAVLFGFIFPHMPVDAPEHARQNMMARSERFGALDMSHPALAPWASAFEVLRRDAGAALPG
jgi:hypothetical protein